MLRSALLASLLVTGTAAAGPITNQTVVHDTTTEVELTLDASTVLCSSADYGALFLKILIPELSKITLLDHQNTGAGAPCVAAGPCEPGNDPHDIIDPSDPTEEVSVRVKAIREDVSDDAAQTCETTLIETVDVTIRGKAFTHERRAPLGTRPYSDCVTSQTVVDEPEEEEPTQPGTETPDEPTTTDPGGCSTSGSSSLAGVLLVGLALVTRRRRGSRYQAPGC